MPRPDDRKCMDCGKTPQEVPFYVYARNDTWYSSCKKCHYKKHYKSNPTVKRRMKAYRDKTRYDLRHRAVRLIGAARRRAKRLEVPFDLDRYVEELTDRIARGCELTGVAFDMTAKPGRAWNAPSLDRIIPEKGYIPSNIRVVCFAINVAMGNWGIDHLYDMVQKWAERNGRFSST